MTATALAPMWTVAPEPAYAAPLRALDSLRTEPAAQGLRVLARVAVDGGSPALRGHFPGLAVYPGIFTLETLGQAIALATGTRARLRLVRSVRFLSTLLDGDELTLDATVVPAGDGWDVTAVGTRGDGTATAKIRAGYAPGYPEARTEDRPAGDGRAAEHVDVRAVLPQRHPLLLLDRVAALEPDRAITTLKAVTGTDPCYAGVPDGAPADAYDYPAPLVVESFGQSAALLWLHGRELDPSDGRTLMFIGARDYRFHGAARPGDVLRHEVRLDSVLADTAFASGATYAGDRLVATVGTLVATRRPVRPAGPETPATPAG